MVVEQNRQDWLFAGVSFSLLLLMVLVLYRHTLVYLAELWNRFHVGEYGHGYLVLAISVFLIARQRRELLSITPCPSYFAYAALIASSLLWFAAAMVDVNMMEAVALLLLIVSLAWVVLGDRAIRILIFPLMFIGFAIPIWFPLSPVLQDLTADVVFWIVRMLDVPAFRQENMIVIPSGTLSVEEACAGLRYLLAALTLGTLYAYLNFQTTLSRLLVILVSAVVAVLANILRVFIVVYLGYKTEMQHPLVDDHLMLGWYLFGGLVAMLLFLDVRLSKYYRPEDADNPAGDKTNSTRVCNTSKSRYGAMVLSAALLVSAAPAAIYSINHRSQTIERQPIVQMPGDVEGWSDYNAFDDDWAPVFNGAIDYKRAYNKANERVFLYIAYYPEQTQGKELINDLNKISDQKVWRTRYTRARSPQLQDRKVLEQLLEKNTGDQRLVWYWYEVAGHATTSKYEAKALQVIGFLTGNHSAYVIAAAADINSNTDDVRRMLDDFLTEAIPLILIK